MRRLSALLSLILVLPPGVTADEPADPVLVTQATSAILTAARHFHQTVAVHGGYVYTVSLDLKKRKGEGDASPTMIWVQPPGTPAVGTAMLRAFEATGDPALLVAATDAAKALVYGQLKSGGWTDRIEFNSDSKDAWHYRNGKGHPKGKNVSTLDDDKSQSAIRLLIEVDKALNFRDAEIHEAAQFALNALLKAQFANGGFPQGWSGPVQPGTVKKASFPDYDWRTEGRIKEYWDYPTLNDGLAGTVVETLTLAHRTYGDERYLAALKKFGDFLILAQLPEPQPAWAQQYNHDLQPMWARKFEPPSVAGRESEDVLTTLMDLSVYTGEKRFLEPLPAAMAWIRRSTLPDGQLARFYELQTNTPLYFVKETYELTYDDSNLPTHYGFKTDSKIDKIEARYKVLASGGIPKVSRSSLKTLSRDARAILDQRDQDGRWVTDSSGNPVTSTIGKNPAELVLKSDVFCKNLTRLSEFVSAARAAN